MKRSSSHQLHIPNSGTTWHYVSADVTQHEEQSIILRETSCCGLKHTHSLRWNSNARCDGVRRWSLWEYYFIYYSQQPSKAGSTVNHFMDEGTSQGHPVSKWLSQDSNSDWLQILKAQMSPGKWPHPTYPCFSLHSNQHSAPISPFPSLPSTLKTPY